MTTTDGQYVPDEGELLEAWIIAHSEPGWGGPVDIGGQPRERIAEGKRALARVKRDAAREALDGLAEWHDREAANSGPGSHYWDASNHVATSARHHRDTHYTETEDQT